MEAGHAGEGEPCGRSTGAKALFCLEADGNEEKGRRVEEELLELPGTVGLEGMMYGELVGEALLNPGDPGTPRLVIGTVP